MPESSSLDGAALRALVSRWGALWEVPDLGERVEIRFSSRFRTSLGRCAPASGEIRLAAFLLEGSRELLREVLCHEAAHLAVHERYRRPKRPHGPEWRALMERAGYPPRARLPAHLLPEAARARARSAVFWEHRCPVCQATRIARRPVRRWRCVTCHEAGRSGALEIRKLAGRSGALR